MLNHATIMGRLVADPELKTTPGGVSVCSFRLACDRDYKDKITGERGVDFISCVAWRNTAEFVSQYFAKGRMAVVDGRIQVRPYTDKEGNKRQAVEIIAGSVYFGDSKTKDSTSNEPPVYSGSKEDLPEGFDPDMGEMDDGDLPF